MEKGVLQLRAVRFSMTLEIKGSASTGNESPPSWFVRVCESIRELVDVGRDKLFAIGLPPGIPARETRQARLFVQEAPHMPEVAPDKMAVRLEDEYIGNNKVITDVSAHESHARGVLSALLESHHPDWSEAGRNELIERVIPVIVNVYSPSNDLQISQSVLEANAASF